MQPERASSGRPPARRRRSRAVRLVEVLSVTVIVAATLVALAVIGLPGEVSVAAGAVLAVASAALEFHRQVMEPRRQKAAERLAQVRKLSEALAVGYLPAPAVRDVDPFDGQFGVFRSEIADSYATQHAHPPYIPRDVDKTLDGALATGTKRVILVAGPAKSGKSRTAYEALLRNVPDSPIMVPTRMLAPRAPSGDPVAWGTLAVLADAERPEDVVGGRRPVLWLDEVDHFVATGELDLHVLRRLQRSYPGLVIMATIRYQALEHMRHARRPAATVTDELQFAPESLRVDLPSQLSSTEHTQARLLYPMLMTEPLLERSMGEYFAAVRELEQRYRHAEAHPAGKAVVRAAIHWRRCGMERPIPKDDLRALAAHCLAALRTGAILTDASFDEALDWARTPLSSSAALIVTASTADGPAFTVFDALLDRARDPGDMPSADTFDLIVERCTPADTPGVAVAALRIGRRDLARMLFEQLAGSHPPAALRGRLGLAELAAESGDVPLALRMYKDVLDAEAADVSAEAALRLGELHFAQGERGQALAAWERAVTYDNADASPLAALRAGDLNEEDGDRRRARTLWQRAAEHGHPEATPAAALRLGDSEAHQGNEVAAEAAWRLAFAYPRSPAAAKAACRLGDLYLARRMPEAAAAAFEKAMDLDAASVDALVGIAGARIHQGHWDRSLEAARLALSRDPGHSGALRAYAAALLGADRSEEAVDFLEETVRDTPSTTWAWIELSRAALRARRPQRAREAADEARALEPGSAHGHLAVSVVTAHERRWDEALAEASAALSIAPDDVDCLAQKAFVQYHRGAVQHHREALDEALDTYAQLLKRAPDYPGAREWAAATARQIITPTGRELGWRIALSTACLIGGSPFALLGTVIFWIRKRRRRRFLPEEVRSVLDQHRRQRRARSSTSPIVAGLLFALGMSWVISGLTDTATDGVTAVVGGIAVAIGIWVLMRWLRVRRLSNPSTRGRST